MSADYLAYIHSTTRMIMGDSDDTEQAHLKDILMTPPPPTLFSGVADPTFEQRFHEISSLLSSHPQMLSMFHLYLLTALLQTPEPVFKEARHFLMNRLDINSLLGFALPPKNPGHWCSIPVVLTIADRAFVRYMILGKMMSPISADVMPSWAVPLFDPATFEAVQTAACAARNLCCKSEPDGLFCFPLTTPSYSNHSLRFEGLSLGLPLALGFAALLNQHTMPRNLAATGRITEQGDILSVAHLDLKKYSLVNARFKALIYPSTGSGFCPSGPIICLPVSSLNQAYALFSLYSPESTENLVLLSACLNDPEMLAKNIGNLPSIWLDWITRHSLVQPAINALTKDSHLFAACTDIFLQKVNTFDTGHARTIQNLIPEQAILEHSHAAPLSVFRWCTASLALANHCGHINEADFWKEKGQALADTISKIDLDLMANFFNHALVARHNRYLFSPELPPVLTGLLPLLENLYHQKCDYGCPTDPLLGRLYGTLMQHFAFCGPAYLDRTLTFFYKAVQALGKDRVIEYRQEWLRQFNYLTYAMLDADDWTGASHSLMTYFDCARMDELIEQICTPDINFTPWQTALVARYFAQASSHPAKERIFKHLFDRLESDPGSNHPRQLTAFNLGRMALDLQEESAGATLLHQSIDLCFSSDAGPTIQAMALLPISFLPDSLLPSQQVIITWEQTIFSAAARLNVSHFSKILDTPLMETRSRIRQTPGAWFPFNYR